MHLSQDRLDVSLLDVDDAGCHAALVRRAELGVVALHPGDGSLEGCALDVAGGIDVEGRLLAIHLLVNG